MRGRGGAGGAGSGGKQQVESFKNREVIFTLKLLSFL